MFSSLQYAGDLQLEIAFAYGIYGYGLCDQVLFSTKYIWIECKLYIQLDLM